MIDKKTLNELYNINKLSMVEIADKLNKTSATVRYWFQKHSISRRSWSESAYVKQNPNGDPFNIKRDLSSKERELLIAGLMLFWGEGGKKSKHMIQLCNLDPKMIKIFTEFLRKICRIKEEKLRLSVRVYKKFDIDKAKNFWSKFINIPEEQVLVYKYNDPRSKENKQWSENGIVTLQFNNIKLRKWISEEIDKYLNEIII